LYPKKKNDIEGWNQEYDVFDIDEINQQIFKEKGSADYSIGHSFFMKNDSIQNILNKKVIPLLYEYFMGDLEIISKVLGGKEERDKHERPKLHDNYEYDESNRIIFKTNSEGD